MTASAIGAGQSAPAAFVAVSPCRLVDTRTGDINVGARSTPIRDDETYTTPATGTNGNCTLPADAATLVMNVTAADQTSASFMTVFEAGTARPHASNLNWDTAGATANAVTANVSVAGELSFYNAHGSTELIADVVGYYTTAPFDAFYTRTEVDSLIAANPSGTGDVGPKGDTGEQGATGAAGAVGPAGATGEVGLQGPAGEQGEQGETGDSVLDGLSCATFQTIRWNGTAWECTGFPTTVTAILGRYGWEPWGPAISNTFSYYPSNVDPVWSCDTIRCEIHLDDVPDERDCVVTYNGTNIPPNYETYESLIFLYDLGDFNGQPFEVRVDCVF